MCTQQRAYSYRLIPKRFSRTLRGSLTTVLEISSLSRLHNALTFESTNAERRKLEKKDYNNHGAFPLRIYPTMYIPSEMTECKRRGVYPGFFASNKICTFETYLYLRRTDSQRTWTYGPLVRLCRLRPGQVEAQCLGTTLLHCARQQRERAP